MSPKIRLCFAGVLKGITHLLWTIVGAGAHGLLAALRMAEHLSERALRCIAFSKCSRQWTRILELAGRELIAKLVFRYLRGVPTALQELKHLGHLWRALPEHPGQSSRTWPLLLFESKVRSRKNDGGGNESKFDGEWVTGSTKHY